MKNSIKVQDQPERKLVLISVRREGRIKNTADLAWAEEQANRGNTSPDVLRILQSEL